METNAKYMEHKEKLVRLKTTHDRVRRIQEL